MGTHVPKTQWDLGIQGSWIHQKLPKHFKSQDPTLLSNASNACIVMHIAAESNFGLFFGYFNPTGSRNKAFFFLSSQGKFLILTVP